MKNPLHYIHKYPPLTKQLLGISYDRFLLLVKQAELRQKERQTEVERQKVQRERNRRGCKPKLTIPEEVCLSLFYLRQLPTFEVLGFSISKTKVNDTFHYWIKILREVLPFSLLEQAENSESDAAIVRELLMEFELIVDSSDISLFRNQQQRFSSQQSFKGDKNYQGGKNISTPHKKPQNRELTLEQKTENKAKSGERIFVEHLIRLIKVFRIASARFQLHSSVYEQIVLTVCGLIRLRIGSLILPT